MTAMERRELERYKVSTFRLNMENTECFDDVTVYTVEVSAAKHKKVEVIQAKEKELENLNQYGVLEEVKDVGQEYISLRWVIRKKEKADGRNMKYKDRIFA